MKDGIESAIKCLEDGAPFAALTMLRDALKTPAPLMRVDVKQLIADYDAMPVDGNFDPPHPIFLMAQELDNLRAIVRRRDNFPPAPPVPRFNRAGAES